MSSSIHQNQRKDVLAIASFRFFSPISKRYQIWTHTAPSPRMLKTSHHRPPKMAGSLSVACSLTSANEATSAQEYPTTLSEKLKLILWPVGRDRKTINANPRLKFN